MPLTGIEIYKPLPKTNCKKCGFPPCLAFAMKVAQKPGPIVNCPDLSAESKAALEAAGRPPINLVTIGSDQRKIEVGNEVVMFRHEKTFYHPAGLVVRLKDNAPDLEAQARAVGDYSVERVGMHLRLDGVALEKTAAGRPLVYAATRDSWEAMADLALKHKCPLAVAEPGGLGALAGLVEKVNQKGVEDIVLDPGARDFAASLTS